VDKMLESGNYTEAFEYSLSKLIGKKEKDTKYVVALEKAFQSANQVDLSQINYLNQKSSSTDYDRIYKLYKDLSERQNRIIPLLPLVSKDGYIANINTINYDTDLVDAASKASEYHYNKALYLIDNGQNKQDAINAYDHIQNVRYYFHDYKNIDELERLSILHGTTYVNIVHQLNVWNRYGWMVEENMISWPFHKLDNKWLQFDYYGDLEYGYDYTVNINILKVNVGRETEHVRHYNVEKIVEIEEDEHDKNHGQDSTNVVKPHRTKEKKYKAEVTEITRTKDARLIAELSIYNESEQSLDQVIPIQINLNFSGFSCTYRGDKEALEGKSINLDNDCENFPNDDDMVIDMIIQMQHAIFDKLDHYKFRGVNY